MLTSVLLASAATAQEQPVLARAEPVGSFRVVYPEGAELPTGFVEGLVDALEGFEHVPGIRGVVLAELGVIVSLAYSPRKQGRDGWSSPSGRLVVLPLAEAREWRKSKVRRVLRHEMAHVALHAYAPDVARPYWFEEGFAEWVAGGLDCEGEARVAIEVLRLVRVGESLPVLGELEGLARRRLAYDLATTFFEYLEVTRPRELRNGVVLAAIRDRGVISGIREATALDLKTLEGGWHAYLDERFADWLDGDATGNRDGARGVVAKDRIGAEVSAATRASCEGEG